MNQNCRSLMNSALLVLAGCASTAAVAEIYKWVDENGRIHFTDSPPVDKGTKVELDVRQPSEEPDEGEIRRLDLLRQAEIDDAHEERLRELDEQDATLVRHDAGACEQARVSWYALNQRMPVYWTEKGKLRPHWTNDTYRGERRYVSDDERPALARRINSDIHRYCENSDVDDANGSAYQRWLAAEWCEVYKVKLAAALEDDARTPKDKIEEIEGQVRNAC